MKTTKTLTARIVRGLPAGARPRVIVSTDDPDSEHDRIIQKGLSFRDRLRVTFAHRYDKLPVGLVTEIFRFPHRTEAEFEWFANDPDAERTENVYAQGGLDASGGFLVEEAVPNELGGLDIVRSRVIEVALTPVPANERAMALAKSLSFGRGDAIDLGAIKSEDEINFTRGEVLAALREVIPAEVERQTRAVVARASWDLLPPGAQIIELDDEVEVGLTADDVRAALREVVGAEAAAGVRRVMNAALGRVD